MNSLTDYEILKKPGICYAVIDIETTGLDPGNDRIIEIGGILHANGRNISTFEVLINPGIPIKLDAARVNRINQSMLEGKPAIEEIIPDFLNFIENSVLVAHNAEFDFGFINKALARTGRTHLQNPVIDTIGMARSAFPGRTSYALQTLVRDLGIEIHDSHRALADAGACLGLFKKCAAVLNPCGQFSLF